MNEFVQSYTCVFNAARRHTGGERLEKYEMRNGGGSHEYRVYRAMNAVNARMDNPRVIVNNIGFPAPKRLRARVAAQERPVHPVGAAAAVFVALILPDSKLLRVRVSSVDPTVMYILVFYTIQPPLHPTGYGPPP